MTPRARKLKLAPSFIVSLALLPACGSGSGRGPGDCRPPECHMNPPPPPEATAVPTADATDSPVGPAANPPPVSPTAAPQ